MVQHKTLIVRYIVLASVVVSAMLIVSLRMQTVAAVEPTVGIQQEKITISPASQTLSLDAGVSVTDNFKVINNGDIAYDFVVYARPYSVSDEMYEPNFKDTKANADVYKWIQFEKTTYHAEPGQTIEVNYAMRVPSGAAPGGHYGVIFAETKEKTLDATGISRQKRVGKLIYSTVNGNYRTTGEFAGFTLPFWQQQDSFTSSVRVKNTGNADFDADVSTVARDIFGTAKFTYTGKSKILPETTRLINMKWDKAPAFGLFKVEQNSSFLGQKQTNSGYVLLVPQWLPVLLVLIVILGIGYALVQKTRRRS